MQRGKRAPSGRDSVRGDAARLYEDTRLACVLLPSNLLDIAFAFKRDGANYVDSQMANTYRIMKHEFMEAFGCIINKDG